MKVLIVNKFLYIVGGAEKYAFELGDELVKRGESVEYFGLQNSNNVVGNQYSVYAKEKLNPVDLIYSDFNKKQMVKLLSLFKPDIVHMNNISYQLTSSIIDACKEEKVPVVMTIHDPQLVCPNHMLYFPKKGICEDCLEDMDFHHCVKNKCLKNSYLKSYIGYRESVWTHKNGVYSYISKYICPSFFIKDILVKGGYDNSKCAVLTNFFKKHVVIANDKRDYILFYGRISEEKGIGLLLKALPKNVKLIVAGAGHMSGLLKGIENVSYVGYKSGDELLNLISRAKATVYPSLWYENCPLSVIESISYGTPVIGSNQGGIPELIKDGETGLLFNPGDCEDLNKKICQMFTGDTANKMIQNCLNSKFDDVTSYCDKAIQIYKECIQK